MQVHVASRSCVEFMATKYWSWCKWYRLDDNGNWAGTDNYEAGKARYLVELNGFQHSDDEYASFMGDVRDIVFNVASNAST